MSEGPVLPAVQVPSGRAHVAPDGTLWSIFRHPGTEHLLIQRYDPQDRPLPDWHLSQAAYDDYRQRNPQLGLPALDAPDDESAPAAGDTAASTSECRHIAHAGSWTVTSVEPDWCEVGGQAVPFDSHAELGSPERASSDVKAQGTPVYAVSHLGRGVQGNAGAGLGSGTSGASGYTQILSGQNNVKVNGLPVGRHDSVALINCDANGCGGALGQLHIALKPVSFVEQLNREARKTPDDLRADMAYHRQAQAEANARADAIDRQIAALRAQADRASTWNPFNSERRAIGRQIEALQASQRSAASSALWHNDQQRRLFERLYPEAAAGPVMSAAPTTQEARELARRGAEIERERARMEAMYSGPLGAAAALTGVPPELAQAINTVTTLGRRPTPVRAASPPRPQRGERNAQPSATPAPRVPVAAPRPGVYVRPPPRTPRIDVGCFRKNPKSSVAEYDRQLADQERGLNAMSVKDYLDGRARYKDIGRKGTGAAQEKARAEYAKELTDTFIDELQAQGIFGKAAEQQASAMAANRMKTLAALHNPDMIAGGRDVVTSMGDRGVNSSIGAQWKNRVAALDREAMKIPEHERADIRMNARLVRCK